jgi:ribonucleoside-diphosphate reductase alpha chain
VQPNQRVLSRFVLPREDWLSAVERVVQLGADTDDRQHLASAINHGELIPAGQIWRGAGRPAAILYNCFVAPLESEEPAVEIARRITRWTRAGCGVGVNVSDWCRTGGNTSGEKLTEIIEAVATTQQQLWEEGQRRTATMINVDWETRGIYENCMLLSGDQKFRHLNLGVLVPDSVMADVSGAIEAGTDSESLRRLATFAKLAWQSGNPGLLFCDRINEDHPYPERINACNPCAEQHLAANEGCNLASINLAAFVGDGQLSWCKLEAVIKLAVRFLDCVIDQTSFPSAEAAVLARQRRRIGLGVTGFASMLAHLNIEYDSTDAREIAAALASFLRRAAEDESKSLAIRKGGCDWESVTAQERRNAYLLSIAPAGAISLLWNVSSGIEPIFSTKYKRGDWEIEGVLPHRRVRTALDISSDAHVQMLAIWQQFVDGGVSKTVNMPVNATPDEILRVFLNSWRLRVKGVTVFRSGSRPAALIPLLQGHRPQGTPEISYGR